MWECVWGGAGKVMTGGQKKDRPSRAGFKVRTNFSILSGGNTARSLHRNGVNVALGDASVRYVSNLVDQDAWGYALAIADRNAIDLPTGRR